MTERVRTDAERLDWKQQRAAWAAEVSALQEELARIEDLTAPEREAALDEETVVEVWEIARAAPSKGQRAAERVARRFDATLASPEPTP